MKKYKFYAWSNSFVISLVLLLIASVLIDDGIKKELVAPIVMWIALLSAHVIFHEFKKGEIK